MLLETLTGPPNPDYQHGISDLSPAAQAIPVRAILDRIEGYTGRWFGSRSVTWLVQGPALFRPTLATLGPVVVSFWDRAWTELPIPYAEHIGFDLSRAGRWMVAGIAGSDDPLPEPFAEAYRRLSEYLAAGDAAGEHWVPGLQSLTVSDNGVSFAQRRDTNWKADAMRQSGAADALRYHRRHPRDYGQRYEPPKSGCMTLTTSEW